MGSSAEEEGVSTVTGGGVSPVVGVGDPSEYSRGRARAGEGEVTTGNTKLTFGGRRGTRLLILACTYPRCLTG